MKKRCGIIAMGLIFSFISLFGCSGCGKKKFKPSKNAVISCMRISHSGMMNGSQYHFSLETIESTVVFNGSYYSYDDNSSMTYHNYENVTVDPSYMEELRKIAAEKNLVIDMKKYRTPKIKFKLLDGDMNYTFLLMNDGSSKSADTSFGNEYSSFFRSIADAYNEFESDENLTSDNDS